MAFLISSSANAQEYKAKITSEFIKKTVDKGGVNEDIYLLQSQGGFPSLKMSFSECRKFLCTEKNVQLGDVYRSMANADWGDYKYHFCPDLAMIRYAKDSKFSYWSKDLTKDLFENLNVFRLMESFYFRYSILDKDFLTLKDIYEPERDVLKLENNYIFMEDYEPLEEGDTKPYGSGYNISILAKGDFNNDNVEDLLVSISDWSKQGTHHWNQERILTRNEDGGTIQNIHALDFLERRGYCSEN